jgi:hypothetical protein
MMVKCPKKIKNNKKEKKIMKKKDTTNLAVMMAMEWNSIQDFTSSLQTKRKMKNIKTMN